MRAAVVGATVSAALAFTYFDTQPYDKFTIVKQSDIATAVSLVIVGLLTGEVALRMARARRNAESVTALLGRVRDSAALLAQGEELAVFIDEVAGELVAMIGAETCEFSAEPLSAGMSVVDRSGNLHPLLETPHSQFALPVWTLGEIVGHFLVCVSSPADLSAQRLQIAMILADNVGAALAAQGPLPPLPTGTGPNGTRVSVPPQRLRVMPSNGRSSAGFNGTLALERFEEFPQRIQDGELTAVGADGAFNDQLSAGFDSRDFAPAEEGDSYRPASVNQQTLEGGGASPRLDGHGTYTTDDPSSFPVLNRADRDGFRNGLKARLPFALTALRHHRRAS